MSNGLDQPSTSILARPKNTNDVDRAIYSSTVADSVTVEYCQSAIRPVWIRSVQSVILWQGVYAAVNVVELPVRPKARSELRQPVCDRSQVPLRGRRKNDGLWHSRLASDLPRLWWCRVGTIDSIVKPRKNLIGRNTNPGLKITFRLGVAFRVLRRRQRRHGLVSDSRHVLPQYARKNVAESPTLCKPLGLIEYIGSSRRF